jgi:hypothetical protein
MLDTLQNITNTFVNSKMYLSPIIALTTQNNESLRLVCNYRHRRNVRSFPLGA